MTFASLAKRPTAMTPVVMSLLALILVLASVALLGGTRESDEGAAAHLWQLLIAGQLPVIGIFAYSWLPRAPRSALLVLALQAGALVAAMAPVYFLKL